MALLRTIILVVTIGYIQSLDFSLYEGKIFNDSRAACYVETNLDDATLVDTFVVGNPDNFGCLLRCLYTKADIMNGAGDLDLDNLRKAMLEMTYEANEIEELIEQCTEYSLPCKCATAINIHYCFFEVIEGVDDDDSFSLEEEENTKT